MLDIKDLETKKKGYEYGSHPQLDRDLTDVACDGIDTLVAFCEEQGFEEERYSHIKGVRDYDAFRVLPVGVMKAMKDSPEGLTKAGTGEVLIREDFASDRRHVVHESLHRAQKLTRGELGINPKVGIAKAMGYEVDSDGNLSNLGGIDFEQIQQDTLTLTIMDRAFSDGLSEWASRRIIGEAPVASRYEELVRFVEMLQFLYREELYNEGTDEADHESIQNKTDAVFIDAALTGDVSRILEKLPFGLTVAAYVELTKDE